MRARHDRGFTLLELMVVVLVIAVLLAIAVPTFLGARTRAQDRQAQASLDRAIKAVVIAGDGDPANGLTQAELQAAEPGLAWTAGGGGGANQVSTGPTSVSWHVSPGLRVSVSARSRSGVCFTLMLGPTGRLTHRDPTPDSGTCNASDAEEDYGNGAGFDLSW